jgi:hypothetical protein
MPPNAEATIKAIAQIISKNPIAVPQSSGSTSSAIIATLTGKMPPIESPVNRAPATITKRLRALPIITNPTHPTIRAVIATRLLPSVSDAVPAKALRVD